MKKTILAIALIFILAMSAASWFICNRIYELEYQNRELQTQKKQLEDQNSNLKSQLSNLQEQINQLINQTSTMSSVKITAFKWVGDFNPIVGLLIGYTVNVAIRNNGTIDVNGLTLTVRLLYVATGTAFGEGFTKEVKTLRANTTLWFSEMV